MKLRIFTACIIIAAGLAIIFYPYFKAFYFEDKKNEIMEQWLNTFIEQETQYIYNEIELLYMDTEQEGEEIFIPSNIKGVPENMEGILFIESIDLQSPILYNATDDNLNMAICRLTSSSNAGDYGNYCLSGHKSRIYGRQFNRLHEISTGDIITVQTKDTFFNYTAVETYTVRKEDVWVLESDVSKKEITLITCDYSLQPTGRFIVKGTLVDF